MSNNQVTTWEGLVERNMDSSTIKRMYCLAKSKDSARKELERLCKKEYPDTFHMVVTDIRTSND